MDTNKILVVDAVADLAKLKALASEQRITILNVLCRQTLNVNDVAELLHLPQSNVATNIGILEGAGLIVSNKTKGTKGTQKLCHTAFSEILVKFPEEKNDPKSSIDVEMPIGVFTKCSVNPPCGLCSSERIIGYLDTPDSFLNPDRIKAGLLWCGSGYLEYQFPNNAFYDSRKTQKLEISAELSSETPGTNKNQLSDITVWVNNVEIGSWTSPGDFGDQRGTFTPSWWKLGGSRYGLLKHWSVTNEGAFVDGVQISDVTLQDIAILDHHSIEVRIGVKEDTRRLGGMNIFGRGFGNYDQGIILRLYF
ncbi:MAG: helix-turn-helix domain-containing protein [Treponema sp.]|jgi:predicted transcriptional regulator|nr:helix-turn-helix domain-containing protein [Treponema sp.]